ncbi:hypothetical protein K8T06_00470 [bacterium]|nr:hypothetical protein [bacterium]
MIIGDKHRDQFNFLGPREALRDLNSPTYKSDNDLLHPIPDRLRCDFKEKKPEIYGVRDMMGCDLGTYNTDTRQITVTNGCHPTQTIQVMGPGWVKNTTAGELGKFDGQTFTPIPDNYQG